jgi:hypothetical protein
MKSKSHSGSDIGSLEEEDWKERPEETEEEEDIATGKEGFSVPIARTEEGDKKANQSAQLNKGELNEDFMTLRFPRKWC